MREGQIRSAAFESAELQSERLRIFGVLGFVAVFILLTVVRVFIIRTAYYTTSWVGGFLLAAIIVTYESWALHKVRRTLNVNGSLPIQFWFLSTILETSIPAFAIIFLKSTQLDVVYRYLAGFDIAGWNRPADDTGGDYFDWKALPDGKVVVSLADATGRGIGPALLATACHAYARSSFSGRQELPAALEHLNQELGADLITGRFVPFVAAVVAQAVPRWRCFPLATVPSLFIPVRRIALRSWVLTRYRWASSRPSPLIPDTSPASSR